LPDLFELEYARDEPPYWRGRCAVCGRRIEQRGKGRPRKTCSDRCRKRLARRERRGRFYDPAYEAAKREGTRQFKRWEAQCGELDPLIELRLWRGWPVWQCEYCGKPYVHHGPGAAPRFCSSACKGLASKAKRERLTPYPRGAIIEPLPDDPATAWRIEYRRERGMPLKECPACGKEFFYTGGRPRIYCSTRCRQAAWRYRKRPKYRKCKQCGTEFRVSKHSHPRHVYGSTGCKSAAQRARGERFEPEARACAWCGQGFVPNKYQHHKQIYCCRRCKAAAQAARRPRARGPVKVCVVCGAEFGAEPRNAWRQAYCSARCRWKAKRERRKAAIRDAGGGDSSGNGG